MICILCCEQGRVKAVNRKASSLGIVAGDLLLKYLSDTLSKRTWMQALADLSAASSTSHSSSVSSCDNSGSADTDSSLSADIYSGGGDPNDEMLLRELLLESMGMATPAQPGRLAQACYTIELRVGRFTFYGFVRHTSAEPRGQRILIQTVPSSIPYTTSSLSEDVDRHFIYDMSRLDEQENAVIATDRIGKIIYANDTVQNIYGWTPSEMVGRNVMDLVPHESAIDLGNSIMKSLTSGHSWSGLYTNKHRNGGPIECFVTDYPIFDSANQVIGIVGVSCIKRKDERMGYRTVEMLNQEKSNDRNSTGERKPTKCDEMPCFLVACRPEEDQQAWKVKYTSSSWLMKLGDDYRPGQILPRNMEAVGALCVSISDTERLFHIPFPDSPRSLDNLRRNLEVTLKEATAHTEVNATKMDFILQVSHELRTPLAGIIGEIDHLQSLLKQDCSVNPITLRESLEVIEASANIQLALVNNVLDWQQLEHDSPLKVSPADIVLVDIVQIAVLCHRWAAKQKDCRINAVITKGTPGRLFIDGLRLSQVLLNLINNAVKYSFRGTSIDVSISFDPVVGCLKVTVEDCGPGISQRAVEELFKRFARVRPVSATSPSDEVMPLPSGTGLGLYVCSQVVKAMNGRIWYEPRSNERGSRFQFCIQVAKPTEFLEKDLYLGSRGGDLVGTGVHTPVRSGAGSPVESCASSPNDEALRVLIVEDNLINQKVLMKMLEKLPVPPSIVHRANDGIECLEQCLKHDYDVILMDIQMPRLDGVETTRRLRERGNDTKIVAVTANGGMSFEVATKVGMNDILLKPVTRDSLVSVFKKLTDR